ncbi:MAG: methyltransferase domain-containing protein [Candidatus Adiutrix sp.]|jgi:16S rRNA (cytosine967-C5)-methyltransferase|nr:methyltransferase domain-containing protein [Candidatus Adiutrix sp.]
MKNKNRPARKPAARKSPRDAPALAGNPRLAAFLALKEPGRDRSPEESLARHGLLLSPRDLALATAMVYEVLRHRAYLNWLLKSRLSAGRTEAEVALVLELGLAQLLYFDRLGEHAAVSETVALAKAVIPGRHGLVNAVLRGLLRDRAGGLAWPPRPPVSGDSARDLALAHSYPPWLVRRLVGQLGPEESAALLAAGNRPTPPTLRINPTRISREELKARLPFPSEETPLSPWGLAAAGFAGRPLDWPGYAEGFFAIQDEASQLIGLLSGPLPPGAAVLDACAGLGGKALHLAALNPRATITARDRDPAKLELLEREISRLGLNNLRTESADLLESRPVAEKFDLVLVDAPCSGLGVIRRRPDLKWNKNEDDLSRLAELQLSLLEKAAGLVKAGGRLIYGVCSFSREEGPEAAEKFLAGQPDFAPLETESWPEKLRPWLSPAGHLTLWPHRQHCDGFFWAVFVRRSRP